MKRQSTLKHLQKRGESANVMDNSVKGSSVNISILDSKEVDKLKQTRYALEEIKDIHYDHFTK